jgi:hypothetical protein
MQTAEAILATGLAAKLVRVAPRAAVTGRTLLASRGVPLTRQARMAPAAVDGRGADTAGLDRLKSLTASICGTRVRREDQQISAGEVAVLALPNARRDSDFGPRPALAFKGNARIVMLGAGGGILSDLTAASGKPVIPQGTERIAVWAGPADPAVALSGLAGWHDGLSLAYVGWSTCLCSGGSVYSENAKLRRGPESFKAGWIGAKEFTLDSRLVTTRFTLAASTVIVILDENASGDATADFSLALEGASVGHDAAGDEIAPVLLSSGARRILVYSIVPDKTGSGVSVKILRDGSVTLAGVMATTADPAVVAARLTEHSPDALLDAALSNPGASVSVQFVKAAPPVTRKSKGGR